MRWQRIGVVVSIASALAIACVLADPPPITNPPPRTRPLIIGDLVSPPLYKKLSAGDVTVASGVSSITFTIAVQVDPTQTIDWHMVEDYSPNAPPTATLNNRQLLAVTDDAGVQGQSVMDGGEAIRVITETINAAGVDFSTCHTFTFVVAYSFNGTLTTPVDPPGGDRVTWFYEPVSDCTAFDAAPPMVRPDGGSDGASE
jgi:hypothetical protein